jgi:GMP synthase-like glutamine amidotransferase
MIIAIFHCYPGGLIGTSRWSHGSSIWAECLDLVNEDDISIQYIDAVNSIDLPDPTPFHGIIITGSPSGVYERNSLPWISRLENYLKDILIDRNDLQTKVLGGCFGAQILSSSLGGLVEQQGFFVLATESLYPTPALASLSYSKGIIEEQNGKVIVLFDADKKLEKGYARPIANKQIENSEEKRGEILGLLESHGDCVRILPSDAILLASSTSCVNEMFICANGRAIGIQGHPEFSLNKEIEQIIWPRQVDEGVKLTLEQAAESKLSFTNNKRHHGAILTLLRRFLLSEIVTTAV